MEQQETEVSSSPRAKPAAAQASGGASKYLASLPSRGFFSSPPLSSNPGGIRVYLCDRDTAPPEGQLIKTNTTNILIRALQINKQKSESKDVIAKSTMDSSNKSNKRSAGRISEGRMPPKKMKSNSASTSSHRGSSGPEFSEKTLQAMTVERLRTLLKNRGLSLKGKKDELIARLQGEA